MFENIQLYSMLSGHAFNFDEILQLSEQEFSIVVLWNANNNALSTISCIQNAIQEYLNLPIRFIMIHAFTEDHSKEEDQIDRIAEYIDTDDQLVEHFYIEPNDTLTIVDQMEAGTMPVFQISLKMFFAVNSVEFEEQMHLVLKSIKIGTILCSSNMEDEI